MWIPLELNAFQNAPVITLSSQSARLAPWSQFASHPRSEKEECAISLCYFIRATQLSQPITDSPLHNIINIVVANINSQNSRSRG
jgi:hypothetical protein